MNTRVLRKNAGFTLVELMVVVAIIGVLTSVAIPNFRRYQAKSKTSEAKLQLAGLYTAMITIQSDYDHFATCIEDAGFPQPTNNYYSVGFDADNNTPNAEVRANGGTCDDADAFAYAAGKNVGGTATTIAELDEGYVAALNSGAVTSVTVDNDGLNFIAAAVGYIDNDFITKATASAWGINDQKLIRETNKGY